MNYLLRTNRLFFRCFLQEDAYNLYLLNNDFDVMRYTGDYPFIDEKEALNFINSYDHYEKFGMGRWIIETEKDFVGWCGLKTNLDGRVDIGFRILKKFWGKGYAKEAGIACLNYGFNTLNLETIIAKTSINNIRAQKLIYSLGMYKNGNEIDKDIGNMFAYEIDRKTFNLSI